ncbi:MAG: SUMF1/EgtB/PvdO family nonheme iron enzyme [Desulfobacteraceae bacterium]|nr:SUMF1/EgtB/PvdO family nonheme iron enzyme [Desulfobacteraceae bacterium]
METFFQAVLFLEENQRVELRFLKLLEPIIREKVGEEIFFKTKYQLQKNDMIFRPSSPLFPENLPEIVRSSKDNRLMMLIPHGMCPLEKDDFEGLENIWLSQYYLDIHPVTNKEYGNFVAETGHTPPENWQNRVYDETEKDLPVTNITLKDTEAYCKRFCQYSGL